MRRAQTTRSLHRPSNSGSNAGELGFLRESTSASVRGRTSIDNTDRSGSFDSVRPRRRDGNTTVLDLSTRVEVDEPDEEEREDETLADKLARELRAAEKKNESLTAMVTSLKTQLAARPPLEKIQALEKEHNQLELLYHSTQRENQACMAEIEKGKRRERIMEGELAKVFGDDWQEHLNIKNLLNPSDGGQSSPVMAARLPASASARRPSVVTRGLSSAGHKSSASFDNSSVSRPPSPQVSSSPRATVASAQTPATGRPAITDHLDQIRSLILGMDQKLKIHDTKLQDMVSAAKAEEKKYEKLVATSNASLAAVNSS